MQMTFLASTVMSLSLVLTTVSSVWAETPGSRGEPERVDIRIEGALIGPGKVSNKPWDGPGKLPSDAWSKLASILGAEGPFPSLVDMAMRLMAAHFTAPDVSGVAQIVSGRQTGLPVALSKVQDSFHPLWGVGWNRVVLSDDLAVRVTLLDRDLVFNDSVGTLLISSQALRDALGSRKVHYVPVADQTQRQVLHLAVSVVPSPRRVAPRRAER